jgi:hypothetical protein
LVYFKKIETKFLFCSVVLLVNLLSAQLIFPYFCVVSATVAMETPDVNGTEVTTVIAATSSSASARTSPSTVTLTADGRLATCVNDLYYRRPHFMQY